MNTTQELLKVSLVLAEDLKNKVSEYCGEVRRINGNTQTEEEFMEEHHDDNRS